MSDKGFAQKARGLIDNVRFYWKEPAQGKYMPIKEVAAYAFGGIGAYFIIQLGSTLIVSTTNIIVSTAIGVGPTHSYIIYLIATILNIPLTAVRANMVDNTRGKGGKYRPYLLSMGIPTTLIALIYVWFPYEQMYSLFPGKMFGYEKGYLIKATVVFICNLALHFFFNFFRDAYENLIHVLSPNTQERTDVLAVKAVVYSLAPSIMNILNPVIAKYFANDNQTNILVYRITYPIYAVLGIALTIVVWANTKEKIVQAKTHTIQISFMDSLKEVAKNKYFWIIALAGWLGFLELAYYNILLYNQSYGHTVDGNMYALAWTVIGNASLWGMLFAPFFVKKFGKKRVLVTVNLANVVCILMMIVNVRSFWWLVACIWANYLFGSVEQITTPAIQADIRDFQQYKSGERIDGMFAAVATIGNVVTLATSVVLPAIQEKFGIYEGNGYEKPFDILDINTGEPGLLYRFLPALIIMSAVGAFLNVVPYFFYDFDEKKQKSVIRVLQVRALFEDYANGALKNRQLVEAIDLVENAREKSLETPKNIGELKKSIISEKNDVIKWKMETNEINYLEINKRKIIKSIFLSIITFNVYYLYWKYLLVKNVCVLQNKQSNAIKEFLLIIFVPCYNLYWWYSRGKIVYYEFNRNGYKNIGNEVVYLLLAIFLGDIIATCLLQKSFNNIESENISSKYGMSKVINEANNYNEEIEIAQFVCEELDKFESDLGMHQLDVYRGIVAQGLDFVNSINAEAIKEEIDAANALPKNTREEKQLRSFKKSFAKNKRSAKKAYDKYYGTVNEFKKPDMAALTALFDKEDELDEAVYEANQAGDKARAKELIKDKKAVQKEAKALMDEFAKFGRAAKPLNDAEKFLKQYENYSKFDEIAALYDEAKAEAEREEREAEEERQRKIAAEKAELEAKKANKK